MGLSPREDQKNPNYDWEFLDRHLKIHLKNPGSITSINPSEFIMSNDEMLAELTKNGYEVDTSQNDWIIR